MVEEGVYLGKFEERFFCVYLSFVLNLSFTDLLSVGPVEKIYKISFENLKNLNLFEILKHPNELKNYCIYKGCPKMIEDYQTDQLNIQVH